MSKTTMYVVGGAGALGVAGLIYYFATKTPALPPGGGGGGGGGNQPVIGSTSPNVTGGKPPATSFGGAGLPKPTGQSTTNPLATAQGAQAALQNPQQFLQDVSNFLNGMAAFKQGFQIVNAVYSAVQAFAASNLNYYLPALDPVSFGFAF
jgi:hypothetical protein